MKKIIKILFILYILNSSAFADETANNEEQFIIRIEALDFILNPKPYITKTITVIDCEIRAVSAENLFCFTVKGIKESIFLEGKSMDKKSLIEAAKNCSFENPDHSACFGEVTGKALYFTDTSVQLKEAKINWIKQ